MDTTHRCFSTRPHAANIFRRRYCVNPLSSSPFNAPIKASHRSFKVAGGRSNVSSGSTLAARSIANGLSHQKFTAIVPGVESTQCHHPSGMKRQSPGVNTYVSSGGISAPVPSWLKNSGNKSLVSVPGSYEAPVTSTPLWFADSPSGFSA